SIQWRWRRLPEKRGGYPSKGRCDGGGRYPRLCPSTQQAVLWMNFYKFLNGRPNHRSKAAILFHSINSVSPHSRSGATTYRDSGSGTCCRHKRASLVWSSCLVWRSRGG
uniref:Uncharacterized protein n=1 Tax=Aegilops tauschii subsp. strangulata TaxID=200361 RepID=A0A453SYH8_AEGTS